MYLVITGNEYGFDLSDMVHLNFVDEERSEELYQEYLDEYSCAAIYKVNTDGLKLVKMDNNF